MAVQRKPNRNSNDIDMKAAERFISGANPTTGAPTPERQRKVPVALRFDPDLLTAIDTMATRRGMSRNAIISYWCSKGVESE